jgi:hypothetical protein
MDNKDWLGSMSLTDYLRSVCQGLFCSWAEAADVAVT